MNPLVNTKIRLKHPDDFLFMQDFLFQEGIVWRSRRAKLVYPEHAGFIGISIAYDGKMMYHTNEEAFNRDPRRELSYKVNTIELVEL